MNELNDNLFWCKVEKTKTCWFWLGSKNKAGYGTLGRFINGKNKAWLAHRYSYWLVSQEQPKELHHICKQRHCVNPAHLVPISRKEHSIEWKKDTAKCGHPFDNIIKNGKVGYLARRCLRCRTASKSQRRREIKRLNGN